MTLDTPVPLATVAQFTEGPFANLVSGYSAQAQSDLMLQATRACESACDRRLVPFAALVETQRADAMDIEDALDSYVPLDPTSQLGFSRAQSLGSTLLVRHFWVREFPARYPELWTGSISNIALLRSYSGTQSVNVSTVQYETDTGHVRFQLGTFVPPGTTIVVTYSGGYATVPADLVQACQFMAASMAVKQLDPVDGRSGHDPDALRADALEMLAPYSRR
ncbi:hypothetical protein LN042_11325 [Kitasatospora sp. RB6PN24]|uniref:hypothetical protein n=1 Tax=Kitasatospora humi TaxID=2893891 RepID=UPI001E4F1181|nr:hypothetical protein [Kitasatospora humi]MCC9307686.1 hypothetical protein [Kitasatospora humi]